MSEFADWNRSKWEQKNQAVYGRFGRNCFAWYYAGFDYDLYNALKQYGVEPGASVCDLGTCSGSQAIGLALMGYEVIGTDVSLTALDQAEQTAAKYHDLGVRFMEDDVLDSKLEPSSLDAIFDRGCFHSMYGWIDSQLYVDAVDRLLKPGGLLILKTMNWREKRFPQTDTRDGQTRQMPHHFTREELEAVFTEGFEYLELRETVFQSSVVHPDPIAWMVVVRKDG